MNRRKSFFPDKDLDQRVEYAVHAFRRAAFKQREQVWRTSSPWVL